MTLSSPGLTRVSQQQIGATGETCLAEGLCVPADVLTQALAAVATVLFAAAVLLALSRLHDAVDALDAERDRTRRERDAFAAFVDAVAGIDSEDPRLTDGGPTTVTGSRTGRLPDVLEAYRRTVMDVPHYDDEYDDSLVEHMAAEFGDDVALAVQNGAILSPQLKRTLRASAMQAKQRRERLLAALDAEQESLSTCTRTLSEVDETLSDVDPSLDRPRADLIAEWQAIQATRDTTVSLLQSRQDDIHEQRHVVGQAGGPTTLYEYVYGDLPSSYPVLSLGTTAVEETRSLQRRLSRALVEH
ncbi:hypothetical protein [Halorubellus sp. PRR65]|uniref:DUF7260 family protein n=1 Tax=Halorubellus sp. PRR65 TaxID=3098148 RepID=UPI002B258779|nr:hypothetical protein [Halorubellus sp. PRR65]